MKFIHASDIHLDSPMVGLQRYDGAPVEEIRVATRQTFQNLVDLAISEDAAFVLIAGDLYDGDWKDYNTGLFFSSQMTVLREAGIRVFLIYGNHDALSQITKHLRLPDNVKIFSVQKPESMILEEWGVALHGQGFGSRAVPHDLAVAYPEPYTDLFNIGLLHTSADGREGHDIYAPCSPQRLVSHGYQYWALGHVHKYEVLHTDPWIVYPGNTQGRHVRETGPKGCTLVTLEDGKVLSAKQYNVDVVRWIICTVDVSGADSGGEVLDRVSLALSQEVAANAGRLLAVRVQMQGSCRAHSDLSVDFERWTNEIRAIATDLSNGEMWIEKVRLQSRDQMDPSEKIGADSALGGLLDAIRNLDANDRGLVSMTDEFADLRRKLPWELRRDFEGMDLENPETFRSALDDVKQLLLNRILNWGEE